MEIQIEIPNVLTCNRSTNVVPLSDTAQACKLELNTDVDCSDIDIDCQIKDVDIDRKLKTVATEQLCIVDNNELSIPNPDLFDDHQPMVIDGSNKDKSIMHTDNGINSSITEMELQNRTNESNVKLTAIDRFSQSAADTANSTEHP